MDIANPVSPFAALLVLALPGVWLAGRAVAWLVLEDRWSARLAVPGMSIALWILGLHIAGLLSGSFHVAIWVGTLAVAAGGTTGLLLVHRGRITPPDDGWQPSGWMWAGAAIAMVVIAPITFGWAFHDELLLDGHMSMSAAIQNGGYPPRSLSFPVYDLRYHYGFALLNAALGSIFRLRIDTGIDLISLAMWGYLFVLFWTMGDRLLGGGRGWITALVVLFGGGLPYLCAATSATRALMLLGVCSTGGTVMNPPFVSYFFQHPWAVGMPIALVLLATFFSEARPRLRYPAMAVLLTALSICQFVLFSALGAALIVAETWKDGTVSFRRGLAMLVTSGAALAAASRMGGFFADTPVSFFASLTFQPGVAEGTIPIIRWHLVTFGLLVPLGAAGMVLMKSGRLLTFCLVTGSLVIVNAVRYAHSWDIIKFGVIASVGLSVAASIAIARMLETRRTPVRIAGGGALIGTITAGLLFVAVITVDMPGIPDFAFNRSPMRVSPDDAQAISWLRRHVATGQTVYRSRPEAIAYAQRGGLPQALTDGMAGRFGFYDPALGVMQGVSSFVPVDRIRLFRELPPDPEAYLSRDIRWFVIDSDEDRLIALTQSWVDSGHAIQRATFGELRVIELPAGL